VTTDGSVTDIPRANYLAAEERAVAELKRIEKPFVILLNCKDPASQMHLQKSLEDKYEAPVYALNAETMGEKEIMEVLQKALFEFPVARIDVCIPKWLQAFSEDNASVSGLMKSLKEIAPSIKKMRDCFLMENVCKEEGDFSSLGEIKMDLGKGHVEISLQANEELFYRVLSEECGENIQGDLELMQYVRSLASVKHGYEKVKEALAQAEEGGYGIVYPQADDYRLQKPQLIKKSAGYGVQFRANAPSYHIVRVDVTGCVSPIIGTKQQGEDFISDALKHYDEDEKEVWETNIFGKSLLHLVEDELDAKTNAMPADIRKKMRRTMSKIVNEGKGNVFCILF
jgi:stage IV sporulation protein A